MSTYAADRTREAWDRYADRLRDLKGPEYDAAEGEAWEELRAALQAIEDERSMVGASTPGA